MSDVLVIGRYGLDEGVRRRVFRIVLALSAAFLLLYAVGAQQVFEEVGSDQEIDGTDPVDARVVTGATLLGLAMFATLFLGAVLAIFLSLGAVRADAERGLLQSLVVRPVGRSTLLIGRFAGAAAVSAAYVVVLYLLAVLVTGAVGGYWPDRVLTPSLELALAIAVITALTITGSVLLSATANGIAMFMVFGAGLVAGLLGQIGDALGSDSLEAVATAAAWVLPFEALYQDALHGLTAETTGLTGFALNLGPFGGADAAGPLLPVWAVVYVGLVGALADRAFRRLDL